MEKCPYCGLYFEATTMTEREISEHLSNEQKEYSGPIPWYTVAEE